MGLLLDLYENIRKTKTDVKPSKTKPRQYNYDAGFTGDRKGDYASVNKQKDSKEDDQER